MSQICNNNTTQRTGGVIKIDITDIERDRLKDSVVKALKADLDDIFSDEGSAAEIKRLEYGKQLVYNMGFLENIAMLANALNNLGEINEEFLATTSTKRLLDAFRIVIDGIEETFKAKDKELETVN